MGITSDRKIDDRLNGIFVRLEMIGKPGTLLLRLRMNPCGLSKV